MTYRETSKCPYQKKKKVNRSLKKRNKRTMPPILSAITAPFSTARRRSFMTTKSSLPLWARGTGARKYVSERALERHLERQQERQQDTKVTS